METEQSVKKRRGRPAGQNYRRYSVMLDPDDAEWARDQSDGLSNMLREGLNDTRRKQSEFEGSKKRLWRLGPEKKQEGDKFYIWDNLHANCAYGFVIRAESEKMARFIAGTYAGEEGGTVWADSSRTWCEELVEYGDDEMILVYMTHNG